MLSIGYRRVVYYIYLILIPLLVVQCSNERDDHSPTQFAQRIVIKLSTEIKVDVALKRLIFVNKNPKEISVKALIQLNKLLKLSDILSLSSLVKQQSLSKELDKYVSLLLPSNFSTKQKALLIKKLSKNRLVTHAYIPPIGEDAGMDVPSE